MRRKTKVAKKLVGFVAADPGASPPFEEAHLANARSGNFDVTLVNKNVRDAMQDAPETKPKRKVTFELGEDPDGRSSQWNKSVIRTYTKRVDGEVVSAYEYNAERLGKDLHHLISYGGHHTTYTAARGFPPGVNIRWQAEGESDKVWQGWQRMHITLRKGALMNQGDEARVFCFRPITAGDVRSRPSNEEVLNVQGSLLAVWEEEQHAPMSTVQNLLPFCGTLLLGYCVVGSCTSGCTAHVAGGEVGFALDFRDRGLLKGQPANQCRNNMRTQGEADFGSSPGGAASV